MALHSFHQALTIAGEVVGIDPVTSAFTVETRSGDQFEVMAGPTTIYQVLTNLDG
jgi:hypothetical protein